MSDWFFFFLFIIWKSWWVSLYIVFYISIYLFTYLQTGWWKPRMWLTLGSWIVLILEDTICWIRGDISWQEKSLSRVKLGRGNGKSVWMKKIRVCNWTWSHFQTFLLFLHIMVYFIIFSISVLSLWKNVHFMQWTQKAEK